MARQIIAYPGQLLRLGRVGENNATKVLFPLKEVIKTWGNGVPKLIVEMPNKHLYPVTDIETTDAFAIWTLSASDLAMAGKGSVEFQWCDEDENILAKPCVFFTEVEKAKGIPGTIPSAEKNWLDKLEEKVLEANQAAIGSQDSAKHYAESAEESLNAINAIKGTIATMVDNTEAASTAAQNAAASASESATKAQEAVEYLDENIPVIKTKVDTVYLRLIDSQIYFESSSDETINNQYKTSDLAMTADVVSEWVLDKSKLVIINGTLPSSVTNTQIRYNIFNNKYYSNIGYDKNAEGVWEFKYIEGTRMQSYIRINAILKEEAVGDTNTLHSVTFTTQDNKPISIQDVYNLILNRDNNVAIYTYYALFSLYGETPPEDGAHGFIYKFSETENIGRHMEALLVITETEALVLTTIYDVGKRISDLSSTLQSKITSIQSDVTRLKNNQFSGSYNDLKNKPTIPEPVTDTHINSLIDAKINNTNNFSLAFDPQTGKLKLMNGTTVLSDVQLSVVSDLPVAVEVEGSTLRILEVDPIETVTRNGSSLLLA